MYIFSSLLSSLFLSSLCLAVGSLPVESAAKELRQLDSSNFSSSIKNGVWFVEFFSPWCGHCKHFAPTWKKLVEHVEDDNPGITLAQVNCVTQADLCDLEQVKGYPSLRLYQDGENIEEYDNGRDFDLLSQYVSKHARRTELSLKPQGTVLSLNKSTFKEIINQGPVFIKFFAPWCGHCKKLAPKWAQFAERMKGKVTVAEVNCDENKSVCSEAGIQGYPTIFFYQHGRILDYTGRRTVEAFEAFADTALAPPLAKISASELTSVIEDQDVLFLLIHEKLDQTIRDNIEEAVQPLHGSPKILSIQSSPDLLASLSLPPTQTTPVIVSLKDHSMATHRQLEVSESSTVQDLSNWLLKHSLPTSTELNAENFAKIMGPSPAPNNSPSRLVVLTAVNVRNPSEIGSIKQAAATWHRSKDVNDDQQVVFAWMDRERWGSWLKSLYGVQQGLDPVVIVIDHGHLLYYDEFSDGKSIQLDTPSIVTALQAVQSGALKAKHSENVVERFVRWLNGWVLGLQSAMVNHPKRSVLFGVLAVVGIFYGLKRLLDEDVRKVSSVYINQKSGTRLD